MEGWEDSLGSNVIALCHGLNMKSRPHRLVFERLVTVMLFGERLVPLGGGGLAGGSLLLEAGLEVLLT